MREGAYDYVEKNFNVDDLLAAIGAGDVQWMTAGRGILHEEMPQVREEGGLTFLAADNAARYAAHVREIVFEGCRMLFERYSLRVPSDGPREELVRVARDRVRRQPERYVQHVYGEYEVGGTSWLYLSDVPFEQIGLRTDLGIHGFAELTQVSLAAVPSSSVALTVTTLVRLWPTFNVTVVVYW